MAKPVYDYFNDATDLAGDALALTVDDTVIIDVDAAGHGWFVDATPQNDVEFSRQNGNGELMADSSSEAHGKMDLLTVIMHEIGHILGYYHVEAEAHDLMSETLGSGLRRSAGNHGDTVIGRDEYKGHWFGLYVWDGDGSELLLRGLRENAMERDTGGTTLNHWFRKYRHFKPHGKKSFRNMKIQPCFWR